MYIYPACILIHHNATETDDLIGKWRGRRQNDWQYGGKINSIDDCFNSSVCWWFAKLHKWSYWLCWQVFYFAISSFRMVFNFIARLLCGTTKYNRKLQLTICFRTLRVKLVAFIHTLIGWLLYEWLQYDFYIYYINLWWFIYNQSLLLKDRWRNIIFAL